jgi:hypothetical protein
MINRLLLSRIAACALALPALADWDPSNPNTKWVQMPKMNGGYDVLSMSGIYPNPPIPGGLPVNKVVADDWMCLDPRPVTDIHVWGSWWQDQPDPNLGLAFELKIYSDIPAVPGVTYSRPGTELWSVIQTPTVRPWGSGIETFYDPNNILPPSPETQVWQYNFVLDPSKYFQQTQNTIYWLSVKAIGPSPGHVWGWKTSDQNWNDDATWADYPISGPGDWNELRDPLDPSKSLDMAFALTVPEPRTYALLAGLGLVGFAAYRRLRR